MRALHESNLAYPALVEIAEGGNGSGSGFYLNFENKEVYFITAKHVLFDIKTGKPLGESINLLNYSMDATVTDPVVRNVKLREAKIKVSPNVDLVAVKVGDVFDFKPEDESYKIKPSSGAKLISSPKGGGVVSCPSSNLKKFKDVLVANEVYVMGYPTSLGGDGDTQFEKARPLLRHGIVAGLNHKNRTVILDCPVYFGNSGGMAVQVEESFEAGKYIRAAAVIGIVVQYIPFVERLVNDRDKVVTAINRSNSGYSVLLPSDHIIELLAE